MNIIGKAKELEINQFYIMEYVLIDTKNPKVRIKILMTGTKLAECHQKMADCDDLAVCSKLSLNWKIRIFV